MPRKKNRNFMEEKYFYGTFHIFKPNAHHRSAPPHFTPALASFPAKIEATRSDVHLITLSSSILLLSAFLLRLMRKHKQSILKNHLNAHKVYKYRQSPTDSTKREVRLIRCVNHKLRGFFMLYCVKMSWEDGISCCLCLCRFFVVCRRR